MIWKLPTSCCEKANIGLVSHLVFVPVEELTQTRVAEAKQFVAYIEKLLSEELPGDDE